MISVQTPGEATATGTRAEQVKLGFLDAIQGLTPSAVHEQLAYVLTHGVNLTDASEITDIAGLNTPYW